MSENRIYRDLMEIYDRLFSAFGPQHWWPADTPFEVVVGAILTQNTSWKNVEKAIGNLKARTSFDAEGLKTLGQEKLAEAIVPAGYYNQKSKRLIAFLDHLYERYEGSLEFLFARDTWNLREELLSLKGIGPETADSILLYAAGRPVFVVDRYTYRIFTRHGLLSEDATYDEMQAMFMDNLPEDIAFFNEFHALVVAAGSGFCKKRPRCAGCPLEEMLEEGLEVTA